MERSERFWNPYVAGVALGLVLLATLLVMGKGLGASGTANRIGVTALNAVAPGHVDANPYMAQVKAGGHPLDDWLAHDRSSLSMFATSPKTGRGRRAAA